MTRLAAVALVVALATVPATVFTAVASTASPPAGVDKTPAPTPTREPAPA